MPDMTRPSTLLGLLEAVNKGLGQATVLVPLVTFAIAQVYALFRRREPGLTDEQIIERFATEAAAVKTTAEAWLLAHGYRYDNGTWVPPQEG